MSSLAHAIPYTFVRVADSATAGVGSLPDGGFSSHHLQFDFNNVGTVAFGTVLPSGETRIYKGSGGPLSLVVADNPAASVKVQEESVSINDLGVVSFMRQSLPNNIRGIYRSDGATIYEAAISGPRPSERPTAINNAGQVAFHVPNYRTGVNAVLKAMECRWSRSRRTIRMDSTASHLSPLRLTARGPCPSSQTFLR